MAGIADEYPPRPRRLAEEPLPARHPEELADPAAGHNRQVAFTVDGLMRLWDAGNDVSTLLMRYASIRTEYAGCLSLS